jgi:6-phosphogluconate dehydrogenase
MRSDLLKSQFEILEEPKEALKIEVSLSPNYIVKKIMNYIK